MGKRLRRVITSFMFGYLVQFFKKCASSRPQFWPKAARAESRRPDVRCRRKSTNLEDSLIDLGVLKKQTSDDCLMCHIARQDAIVYATVLFVGRGCLRKQQGHGG